MNKIMLLKSEFGDNIFTRSSMSYFFEKVNLLKSDKIILDFKDVKFISRSCADEYLKQKKESRKKIVEINLSDEVKNMFTTVINQYRTMGFIAFSDINNQELFA